MKEMSRKQILEIVDSNYDFTLDTKCNNYLDEKLDNIDRYFIYKMKLTKLKDFVDNKEIYSEVASKKSIYKGLIDPDSNSNILQNIYLKLWPDLSNKPWMKYRNKILGDTMTSCTTTLNLYLEEKYGEPFTNKKAIIEYLTNREILKDKINKDSGVNLFMRKYHALGNFIPVPIGFNSSRSGYGKHDYWDLTLIEIKNWYDNNNDKEKQNKILKKLLHNKTKYIKNCEKWLEYFKTWSNFIKENYLDDYIKDNQIIKFNDNHSWYNQITDVDIFYERLNEIIDLRSARLLKELKNKK